MKTRYVLFLVAGLALCGCAPGSGEGLNVSGRPLSEGGNVPLAATLESIQVNVFDASCIVCHAGAAAPLGLRLDASSSFTNLVGVPSQQAGSSLRVEPGDPDRSYLIRKLDGTAGEGEQMPLGGPPIPQATIDFVRQWILDGARPDASPVGVPPTVISLIPAPDSSGPDFPTDIIAGFNQEIDASTINDLTFTIERSGGDAQFGNGNDVSLAATMVSLSPANPRLAVMSLAGVAAIEDRYRVTLKGSGPNVVLSVDGLALDGEFGAMFPSGDGGEGGDFIVEFEIRGVQPSLTSIQANVFAVSCAVSGCHSGPTGPDLPRGMDLTSEQNSFDNLVSVNSVQSPGTLRVAPGDAGSSYLVRKLEGTAAVGQRMPLGGAALDQAAIDVIRAWIDDGALR